LSKKLTSGRFPSVTEAGDVIVEGEVIFKAEEVEMWLKSNHKSKCDHMTQVEGEYQGMKAKPGYV
jgi:hypothetical protein